MITYEVVKKLFEYQDGKLFWKVARGGKKAGDEAGCINKLGYRRVVINGKSYFVHRIIWLYTYGEMPKEEIDHINHNRSDNRIENIRAVSRSDNAKNHPITSNNKSGCTGVSKFRNKWRAITSYNGEQIYLGLFDDKETAANITLNARTQLGFHENHGGINL
jgi:hypothetical protein